jgi:hypothetical protein
VDFGAAVIASPIQAYKELGEDICMTVDWGPDEQAEIMGWRECVEHLIDNPKERWERLAMSQHWMAEEWDLSVGWQSWNDFFSKVLAGESVAGLDYTPKRKVKHEVQGDTSGADCRVTVHAKHGDSGTEADAGAGCESVAAGVACGGGQ